MKRSQFESINLGRPFLDSEGWTCVNVYSMSGSKCFGRIRLNVQSGKSEIVSVIEMIEKWMVE